MRIFSPFKLSRNEIYSVKTGMYKRVSPVPVVTKAHGPINFIPVRVHNMIYNTYIPFCIGSVSPIFDVQYLRNVDFKYIYTHMGDLDVNSLDSVVRETYTARHDLYLVKSTIPVCLKDGDVLLASGHIPANDVKGIEHESRNYLPLST
jgi:hypothetical protein